MEKSFMMQLSNEINSQIITPHDHARVAYRQTQSGMLNPLGTSQSALSV